MVWTTLRLLLMWLNDHGEAFYCFSCCSELVHIDITNVFLHGELYEDVYMKLPPGYFELSSIPQLNNITDYSNLVCKLKKSIYGLKQAPRCQLTKFASTFKSYNFTQCHVDNSLFTLDTSSQFVAVLVYMDDIFIAGTHKPLIQSIITYMGTAFKVKDMGSLQYFLRIEVAWSTSAIYLHQRKNTLDSARFWSTWIKTFKSSNGTKS